MGTPSTKTSSEKMTRTDKETIVNKEIYTLANSTAEKFLNEHYEKGEYELFNFENETADEQKEVFQWFIVSDWFADHAKKNGAVILETDDLNFWGRECCGIAILDTDEIDTIFSDL